MKTKLDRRNFIKKSSKTGIACCALVAGSKLATLKALMIDENLIINPKDLCYCGYTCPDECEFYVATIENNVEKKKAAFEKWEFEKRYGLKFDPEAVFCFKCKPGDKQEGIGLKNCTVRKCAVEKELDCCIECDALISCDKDLWLRFPDFKKMVIEMQVKYRET